MCSRRFEASRLIHCGLAVFDNDAARLIPYQELGGSDEV